MTEEAIIARLVGAYDPVNPCGSRIQDFTASNLLAVCKIIIPGEFVQCLLHNTVLQNPSARFEMLLDYVPVSEKGTPLFFDTENPVSRHFFITRPNVVEKVYKELKLSEDELSSLAMINLWNFIAHQMRRLVQVRFAKRCFFISFDMLATFGVPRLVALAAYTEYLGVCKRSRLCKRERILYADRCCVAMLCSKRITESIRCPETSKFLHWTVANTIIVGVQEL